MPNILPVLYENDANIPAGEIIWRFCVGLNPAQANDFIQKYDDLIKKIRQLASYKTHQLFKNNPSILLFILDNPWLMAFFTTEQLIALINSPVSDETSDKIKSYKIIQDIILLINSKDSIEKFFF